MIKKVTFLLGMTGCVFFAQAQPETYPILFPNTIGLTMTSGDICTSPFTIEEAHQTAIGNTWGCTWTSIHPGMPSSVQVKVMFSVSDGSAGHPTTLNGIPDVTVDAGPAVSCGAGTLLTWNLDPASYNPMGTNTFLVDFSASPVYNQLDNLDESDPYMYVIVDYTPCTPPALSLNTSMNVSCFGAADGSVDVAVSGGTPGYTFDWDNDGTGDFDDTEDLSSLSPGTYNLTVMDDLGCADVLSVDITQPAAIDVSVTQDGATLTANATGVSYQWAICTFWSDIVGATNASYTAPSDGYYAVIITDGSCVDTSDCIELTGLGLEESAGSLFTVYPNPSTGEFTVDYSFVSGPVIIRVSDLSGRLVGEQLVLSGNGEASQRVNLKGYRPGIYLVHLATPDTEKIVRVICQ